MALALSMLHTGRWTPLPALAGTLGGLWLLDYVLIGTRYRNANGFMECGLNCSTLQDLVGLEFWYGGALLVLAILGSLGALAVIGLRGLLAGRSS